MTWRSVFISHPARLSLKQQQMLIEQDHAYTVPLEDLSVIVIEAREVVITAPLLSALAQYGVTLLTCDDTFLPCGQWLPFAQYHRSLKILKLQINLSEPQKKQFHRHIIRAKIRNQAWLIDYSGHDIAAAQLRRMADEVKSGDKGNFEAHAAALYFPLLFGDRFTRWSEHPVNARLNYGYSILRSAIARALVRYGFLPALGFFHHSELNAFNLADDLIEPYRPLLDLLVWENLSKKKENQHELSTKEKQQLVTLLHHQILLDGQIYSVQAAIDKSVSGLQTALAEKNPKLFKLPELLPLKEHTYE